VNSGLTAITAMKTQGAQTLTENQPTKIIFDCILKVHGYWVQDWLIIYDNLGSLRLCPEELQHTRVCKLLLPFWLI